MDSFILVFSENVRGPICNNIIILNDNIVHESEERLSFNLSTSDLSVILDPTGGSMVILDDDSELIVLWLSS